ncbi:MAG TPA: hypothetical protein VEL75_19875 [Candidatus Methylomirabilis sp.]|nr:hypothetical protein [Candidatus Methylomirabilis sp.]
MSAYQDLLAELELTMVPSLRIRPQGDLYTPERMEPRSGTCTRSFWCSVKKQVAEVEFEKKSILGFPRYVGVRRCSAFDDPRDVACGRHCLDSDFRRRWPFSLPIADHRPPIED